MTPEQTADDLKVTYTLREVIDQINTKLDILPALSGKLDAHEARFVQHENRISTAEGKIDVLEKVQDQTSGAISFKDKAWAKLVGLASIMGVVAGATVGLIELFT